MSFEPAYIATWRAGELAHKVASALTALRSCRLCPRDCDVDRLADRYAVCLSGRHALVSSAFPHFGEEDCLRGWNGSGTIFFGHCNLKCVFCQNFDISQRAPRKLPGMPPQELAGRMLDLQSKRCHNINFVTPEHVVPQVLEALLLAVERGLTAPLVYNTSGYDSALSLELLDGVIDLYMPDIKTFDGPSARRHLKAEGYPAAVKHSVLEMQRQVGDLVIDADGLARRGVLIRHLVMPGMLADTREILSWIAAEVSPQAYVNVMGQYHPAGKVSAMVYPELNRETSEAEVAEAKAFARHLGLRVDQRQPHPRLWRQLAQ